LTWKLTNSAGANTVDSSAVATGANSAPDTATVFSGLNSAPDLDAIGTTTLAAITSGKTTATEIMTTSKATFSTTINTTLAPFQKQITDMIATTLGPIRTEVTANRKEVARYLTEAIGYDAQRILGQMGFCLLYVLPLLFISLGGFSKKPGFMKCCNLICVPYYFLLFILGIVFLLIGVLVGDGMLTLISLLLCI
jgi:hypothetical protein